MRVQSLLSSFVIVLGNFVLHLTLAILANSVETPTQDEMDILLSSDDQDDYGCVPAESI